jgi:hypothetical protein
LFLSRTVLCERRKIAVADLTVKGNIIGDSGVADMVEFLEANRTLARLTLAGAIFCC